MLENVIYKYIIGEYDGRTVPSFIKYDPIILYLRDQFTNYNYCPLCGRIFKNMSSLKIHLNSNEKCHSKLITIINYTIERYLLMAGKNVKQYEFIKKYYKCI